MSQDTVGSSPPFNGASKKGQLIIIAAPSGAGKTSLVRGLLANKNLGLSLSVSTTTRPPRPGEAHGREYFFTSEADFLARKAQGEFLEWALVHGNYYGTSRAWINEQRAQGRPVLLEIDWQGAAQIRQSFPSQELCSIFILPPSLEALRQRLQSRAQDSAAVIEKRIQAAEDEISHAKEFDHVIMNQEFTTALAELTAIVQSATLPPQ
nr:Guanylate kinase [Cupriavidus sp.]